MQTKIGDTTTHPLKSTKSGTLTPNAVRMWHRNAPSLLVRIQNSTNTLEISCQVSYKTKYNPAPWYSSKEVENVSTQKPTHGWS